MSSGWFRRSRGKYAPFNQGETSNRFSRESVAQCRAWATDINPTAVKNTVENAKLHGVDDRVIAVAADVFDHKEIAGKKFDMIYWNCPRDDQHPSPGNEVELLMRSLTDPGYQALRRFLSQARIFLKDSGCVFLGFSLTFGSKELFEKVVAETKWRYKIYSRKIFPLSLGSEHKEEVSRRFWSFMNKMRNN